MTSVLLHRNQGMPYCGDKWPHYNKSLCLLIHITRMLKPLDAVTKGSWTQKSMDRSHDEYNKLPCPSASTRKVYEHFFLC